MNNCVFSGRLINNVERVAYGTEGKNMTNFCISIITYGKDENGYPKSFLLNCTAFGNTGKIISEHFSKGDSIIVSGKLNISKGKNDKMYTSLTVSNFDFCGAKNDNAREENATVEKVETVAPVLEEAPEADLPFDF